MERQPAVHKNTRSVPNKDQARQEFRREEAEREPWSGSRPDKVELPGDQGQVYKEQVSQTDKTAKYH